MAAFAGIVDFERADAGAGRVAEAIATFPDAAFGEATVVSGPHFAIAMRPLAARFDPPVMERPADDGRWVIVGDTRIDARGDLGRALGLPTSCGDEGLVAGALGRWGEGFPSYLLGEFAIAAWDREERRLLLVRDHFGARPLYYARQGTRVAFASSLTALRLAAGGEAEVDLASVADYIVSGRISRAGATFFRDFPIVPPGHLARIAASGLTVTRYWDLPVAAEPRSMREGELVEELSALLRVSVTDRLRGRRASIQLSGGLDSTAIAVVARAAMRETGGELSGLTMSHADLFGDDEPRLARMAGEFLDIPVDELRASEWRLWQGMSGAGARWRELPGWGPLAAAWDEIHRIHGSHGPVVLTGTGGDELFVAPRRPLRWWFQRGDPTGALAALAVAIRLGVRPRFGLRSRGPRRRPAPAIPAWLDEEFLRQSGIRERLRDDVIDEESGKGLPRPDARGFLARLGADRDLELCHPSVTGVPLVYAQPMLDVRLVEAVLAMPPFPWFERKTLLRLTMKGRLPREILRRRKAGLARDPLEAMFAAGLVDEPRLEPSELDRLVGADFRRVSAAGIDVVDRGAWCRMVETVLWSCRMK